MRRTVVRRLTALALSALLASAGPPACAAEAKAAKAPKPSKGSELTGFVRDEAGKPLGGVRVVLTPVESGGSSFSTDTGSGGEYKFTRLPRGLFEISFEQAGQAYVGNQVLMIAPEQKLKANFRLGPFESRDKLAGLTAGQKVPGLAGPAAGVARLEQKTGPTGLAWLRTGKGVAVLVATAAGLVAGVIALTEKNYGTTPPVSPSSP